MELYYCMIAVCIAVCMDNAKIPYWFSIFCNALSEIPFGFVPALLQM